MTDRSETTDNSPKIDLTEGSSPDSADPEFASEDENFRGAEPPIFTHKYGSLATASLNAGIQPFKTNIPSIAGNIPRRWFNPVSVPSTIRTNSFNSQLDGPIGRWRRQMVYRNRPQQSEFNQTNSVTPVGRITPRRVEPGIPRVVPRPPGNMRSIKPESVKSGSVESSGSLETGLISAPSRGGSERNEPGRASSQDKDVPGLRSGGDASSARLVSGSNGVIRRSISNAAGMVLRSIKPGSVKSGSVESSGSLETGVSSAPSLGGSKSVVPKARVRSNGFENRGKEEGLFEKPNDSPLIRPREPIYRQIHNENRLRKSPNFNGNHDQSSAPPTTENENLTAAYFRYTQGDGSGEDSTALNPSRPLGRKRGSDNAKTHVGVNTNSRLPSGTIARTSDHEASTNVVSSGVSTNREVSSYGEDEIEFLAEKIYSLLRKKLEVENERIGWTRTTW